MARAEELEEAKRKLQAKLADAEQDAESAHMKVNISITDVSCCFPQDSHRF